ncbi:MAG TPA: hypothetical protein VKV28_15105 [Candidatus Binataceae bacterium]|nr:hypothetical protein [Candidatus Binataceae bacterium]
MAKHPGAAQSRTELDLPAEPRAALARLRELWNAGQSPIAELADAAGAIAQPEAAELLFEMEASTAGAQRREIRRALFRLRQKGVAVDKAPQQPVAGAIAGECSAWISQIDPQGEQLVWMAKGRATGGMACMWGAVSESVGLTLIRAEHESRREMRAQLAKLNGAMPEPMVEADWSLADFILAEAYRRTPEDKRREVGNYLVLRAELIEAAPPAQFEHPIYREFAATLAQAPAPQLLEQHPELVGLLLTKEAMSPFVAEVEEIRQSPLVLNRFQQQERIEVVVAGALASLGEGEPHRRLLRRLENLAYRRARRGEQASASILASAAARLRERSHSQDAFFLKLVRHALGAALTDQQEEAAQEPRLIMTPAEAMRARANPRR